MILEVFYSDSAPRELSFGTKIMSIGSAVTILWRFFDNFFPKTEIFDFGLFFVVFGPQKPHRMVKLVTLWLYMVQLIVAFR